MKNVFLRLFIALWVVLPLSSALAQTWTPADPQALRTTGQRDIVPQQYRTYTIDPQIVANILLSAPHESDQVLQRSPAILNVALANGETDRFRVLEHTMMEPGLASRYPGIRTFRGQSLSDPYRTIRIDLTTDGFRAVVRDLSGRTFIDPYQRHDLSTRIVYFAADCTRDEPFVCGATTELMPPTYENNDRAAGECRFRSYRLAITTSGEYSNYFGASSSDQADLVLSQVVTAINRINEVYELEFGARFILVDNTDAAFFYSGASDPFSGDACGNLGPTHNALVSIIGGDNFDMGHMFGRGSGGCAGLRSLCSTNNKGRGSTLANPPINDPFYIDYVAHEMGHQFGANHTQNNSCNRVTATAMEPGSASTIMGYAGICSPNVQDNSDDYFHAISLQEAGNHMRQSFCHQTISDANTAPVVDGGADYVIPTSTPFVLTATATDVDGDPLLYCWEQFDNAVAPMPPVHSSTGGPLFRSFRPVSSPSRYFPNLQSLASNVNATWEVLPSVTREMNFRVTVRDIHDGLYGCTHEDDVNITTTSLAGPFLVTSQSAPEPWREGSQQIIAWNVANTHLAPVNCNAVNILLSYDGGLTFPVVLAENMPNNGQARVNIPAGQTTTGRVMVKAADNIFFDINNANIVIEEGVPGFFINTDVTRLTACNADVLEFPIEVSAFMDFTDTVELYIENLPVGSTATFDPPRVAPGGVSMLTISDLWGIYGDYDIEITGVAESVENKTINIALSLHLPSPHSPTLVSPGDNATDAPMTPFLAWEEGPEGTMYDIEIAADREFQVVVRSGTTSTAFYQSPLPLTFKKKYFWRVRAHSACGAGEWSPAHTFTTTACFQQYAVDLPQTIPATSGTTITSTLNCPVDIYIHDVDVIGLRGQHTRLGDLRMTLVAPNNLSQIIFNRPCNAYQDFDIELDDQATEATWPCPPTDGLAYKPANALGLFNYSSAKGDWTLQVRDLLPLNGGVFENWGLRICGELDCKLIVDQPLGSGPGSLSAAIICASEGDTITLSSSLTGAQIMTDEPLVIDKKIVIRSESDNIVLMSRVGSLFEILPEASLELSGVRIQSGATAAIHNRGTVTLNGVILDKKPDAAFAMLLRNSPGAQLIIDGRSVVLEGAVYPQ